MQMRIELENRLVELALKVNEVCKSLDDSFMAHHIGVRGPGYEVRGTIAKLHECPNHIVSIKHPMKHVTLNMSN